MNTGNLVKNPGFEAGFDDQGKGSRFWGGVFPSDVTCFSGEYSGVAVADGNGDYKAGQYFQSGLSEGKKQVSLVFKPLNSRKFRFLFVGDYRGGWNHYVRVRDGEVIGKKGVEDVTFRVAGDGWFSVGFRFDPVVDESMFALKFRYFRGFLDDIVLKEVK